MQFRHPESYRILSDGRILQDPMGSGVGYVDLGFDYFSVGHLLLEDVKWSRNEEEWMILDLLMSLELEK